MNVKTPKDVTRATNRALEQLKDSGVTVKYTQVLSAIAAFHGFSNREEFLASVKKEQSGKPTAATPAEDQVIGYVHKDWTPEQGQGSILGRPRGADYRAVALVAKPPQVAGLMPQAQLLDTVSSVMDRLAHGEDFNDVCEDTGISALVSQQRALLRGDSLAGQPKKGETFIERMLRMSPAELTHADFRMLVNVLRRAFGELRDVLGHEPGWMLPYITVADGLASDADKLAQERAYPYQVVSYASAEAFAYRRHEVLVPAQDLQEAVREMRKRLDENPDVFGCAVVSTDLTHLYYSLVRGVDGNYREMPDGLSVEVAGEIWDEMSGELADLFEGAAIDGFRLKNVAVALETRLCRGAGDVVADTVLRPLGLKTRKAFSCAELYALFKVARGEAEEQRWR